MIASIVLIMNIVISTQLDPIVFQILTAISTFLLVIVTTIYAVSTNKMAANMQAQSNIMTKEFEFKNTPLIDIEGELNLAGMNKIEHSFKVENLGNFQVVIKEVKYDFSAIVLNKYIKEIKKTDSSNEKVLPGKKIYLLHTIYLNEEEIKKDIKSVYGKLDVDQIECIVTVYDVMKREHKFSNTYMKASSIKALGKVPENTSKKEDRKC
ncbi:MAG: hypothetical protein JW786_03605 [Desulfobacterales bacterium]|nr:hypothetical protein [Desulfobacterales bacterium]